MSTAMPTRYDPQTIEARRQELWRERDTFATPPLSTDSRAHTYIKPSAPFTSGNIHIGHVRSYSIGDAYARFCRARGDAVLFAFGYDAFGLPAELGAIANGESPNDWVNRCAAHMTGQLRRLGFSFDWQRSFLSSDPVMYRWSQWLFLQLLDAGLIYHGTGTVDWCEHCQTTLASIQVENGRCWRCHNPVRLIHRPQWFLRISAYVQENDRRLSELENWDESSLSSQRFVLGRVDGVELDLTPPSGSGASPEYGDAQLAEELTVFTPHADALELARFVLISPKHPDVERWIADPAAHEQLEELRSGGLERSSRDAEEIPLIDTGRVLAAPVSGDPLSVLVSPVVDGRFGATAVLGIPALDRTDATIARRLGLSFDEHAPEKPTGGQAAIPSSAGSDALGAGDDRAVPSGDDREHSLRPAVRYRANDFSISRQRSWGTPIPIVHCERCGVVPVPPDELPVLLPLDLKPTGAGNPLAERDDFVHVACPRCGGDAHRETDTLDCHFDALWLWIPACVPPEEREQPLERILALEDLRAWLPSERLVAGSDSGNFVFDQRIVTKALRDIGPLAFLSDGEPFAGCLFHEMVIRDGRKMSKHLGNVVDPDELIDRFGADTVRLALLYAARPQRSLNWSDSAIQRCHRFLTQVWEYSLPRLAAPASPTASISTTGEDGDLVRDTTEHLRRRLEKWCETAAEKITEEMESLEMHSAVRNVMRLFDRIKDFEKRVLARQPELSAADSDALLDALTVLVQLLGPLAPHLAEELWLAAGHEESGASAPWPGVSSRVAA
ncbi:MAG TPA: class I tRNA ligase family protein [Solirubrobacteraceae bacterium]|jgi:leucyl-tRNA synthetase